MIALLVIDVQKALVAGAHRETETLLAIKSCINVARSRDLSVIFIQHCHNVFKPMMKGQPGWQLHNALDAQPEDKTIEKTASDAFYKTDLAQTLKHLDVNHVLVTGLQTEFCVDATSRAALSHGFDVTLISDGHTTGDSGLSAADIIHHHNLALSNLAHPDNSITLCESRDIDRYLSKLES